MDKKKEKEFSTKTQLSRNRNEKNLISEMETDEFKRTGEKLITIKNNEVISNKNYIESDEISNRQESFLKQQSFISISTNQKDLKRINYNILPCNRKIIKNFENESEREKTTSRNRLNSNFPSNTNRINCEEENIPLGICFICDKISQKYLYYSSGKCLHFFCKKCGKYYYEEKIEDGLFYFTCPVFFCKCEMSIEIIKKLVSEEHFNSIKDNQIKINNNSVFSDKKNMTNQGNVQFLRPVADGVAAQVHISGGLEQVHVPALEAEMGDVAVTLGRKNNIGCLCPGIQYHKSDIVSGRSVFGTDVAESGDQIGLLGHVDYSVSACAAAVLRVVLTPQMTLSFGVSTLMLSSLMSPALIFLSRSREVMSTVTSSGRFFIRLLIFRERAVWKNLPPFCTPTAWPVMTMGTEMLTGFCSFTARKSTCRQLSFTGWNCSSCSTALNFCLPSRTRSTM